MNATELALRKELALTRLRIARTELALSRARRKPDGTQTADAAIELATSVLDQTTSGGRGGKWAQYARILLRVAHVVLGVRRAL